MNKGVLIVIGGCFLLVAIGFLVIQREGGRQATPQQPNQTTVTPETTGISPQQSPPERTVNIYLVALDDGGASGKEIGCNDSLVPVEQTITAVQTPLQAALQELLSLKEQYYGESGLYNALYQSNLQIQEVTITDSTAVIRLTGTMQLGGVCDAPRIENQLKETALQFETVERVSIFINGEPLEAVLSERG